MLTFTNKGHLIIRLHVMPYLNTFPQTLFHYFILLSYNSSVLDNTPSLSILFCCSVPSHSVVSNSLQPHRLQPTKFLCSWGFSKQEYWSGLPCPPQGIFPAQGLNPGLPHCRQSLYNLSHQGSKIQFSNSSSLFHDILPSFQQVLYLLNCLLFLIYVL